jgi:hypothetical protein
MESSARPRALPSSRPRARGCSIWCEPALATNRSRGTEDHRSERSQTPGHVAAQEGRPALPVRRVASKLASTSARLAWCHDVRA